MADTHIAGVTRTGDEALPEPTLLAVPDDWDAMSEHDAVLDVMIDHLWWSWGSSSSRTTSSGRRAL